MKDKSLSKYSWFGKTRPHRNYHSTNITITGNESALGTIRRFRGVWGVDGNPP